MTGLLDHLSAVLPEQTFTAFFGVAEVRHGRVLAVPNEFTRSWVSRKFGDELQRRAESTGASAVELASIDRSAPPHPARRTASVGPSVDSRTGRHTGPSRRPEGAGADSDRDSGY